MTSSPFSYLLEQLIELRKTDWCLTVAKRYDEWHKWIARWADRSEGEVWEGPSTGLLTLWSRVASPSPECGHVHQPATLQTPSAKIFMEASSGRHDQLLTPFSTSLMGGGVMQSRRENSKLLISLVLLMTSLYLRAIRSHRVTSLKQKTSYHLGNSEGLSTLYQGWCQRPDTGNKDVLSALITLEIAKVLELYYREQGQRLIYIFSII